jgi:UDP-N-acetylmuramoylalanine--D-glutamate ligase
LQATSALPVVGLIDESTDDTWSVLEVSSFQLEARKSSIPKIAVILNITPDHLDRHGTFENYALAKERIFAAQDASDFAVLNADNARAAEAAARSHAPVFWFSMASAVAQGAWVENGNVVYRSAPGGADRNRFADIEDSSQGRAQRGERAGGRVRGAAGGRGGWRDRPGN